MVGFNGKEYVGLGRCVWKRMGDLKVSESEHNYSKHDIVNCGLCEESFVCLCNRAAECPCAQVNLTRDEAEWIGWQTGQECVCLGCLVRLREEARGVGV